jgi:O-antigen/teichoic acid export membrane protein
MNSSFLKSVLKLSTFSIVGQLSSVVALPLITRMFTPDEFGVYSFFVTLVTLIGVLATGMYHRVILITNDSEEADQLFFLVLFISLVVGFLSFFAVHVATVFNFLKNDNVTLAFFSEALFLALVLYASSQALYLWNNRSAHYNLMGASSLCRDVVASVSKLAFGYFGILKFGLVYGFLIAQLTFFIFLFVPFLSHIRKKLKPVVNIKYYYALGKKYSQFPKFALPTDFLASLSIQAPVLFMGLLFEPKILGFYALARTVLGLPVTVLCASVGAVFQKEASDLFNANNNCETLYLRLGSGIFLLGIIPLLLVMYYVEDFFVFTFGMEWSNAGYYCAILSPMYLFRLIGKPLSFMFILTQHLKLDFILMLSFTLSSALSLGLGYYLDSPVLAVLLISVTHTLCYLAYIIIGFYLSRGLTLSIR